VTDSTPDPTSLVYESYAQTGFGGYDNAVASPESFAQYVVNYSSDLPTSKAAAILDVGCGAGHFLAWLRERGFTGGRGIDLSENSVAHCRHHGLAAEVVGDSSQFLAAHAQAFDLIAMNDVIEHFPYEEVVGILSNARAALKPGGTLLVKTINMANAGGLYLRYADFTHRVGFTETSLRQVLVAAGFGTVTVEPYRIPRGGVKRALWSFAGRSVQRWRAAAMFADLGVDAPRILSKILLATARV
jgi:2-polyprenyl-3-methyl-5-hydroxy-6-metoxy-1,4-benzoquinol methylase